jgi:mannose-1-phosphate guanylyltransferase/phosphomannomutase
VYDLEVESIPLNKYSIRFVNANMGIYVQKQPLAGLQFIQIKLFNRHGFQFSPGDEKKIENIFFRGDYPRKDPSEVGEMFYPIHRIESYITDARKYFNSKLLKERGWNLTVDCLNGAASDVFPNLLNSFGCNVTLVHGQVREYTSEDEIKKETRKAVENMVEAAKTGKEIGVIIGPHGEYLTIVDETGNIITNDEMSAILSIYYLKYKNEKIINIPVTSSRIIDRIAALLGGRVVRTSSKLRSPAGVDESVCVDELFLKGSSGTYPYIEKDYDPMITFLKILEFLTLENTPLYKVREDLPRSNLRIVSIPCTIEEKAAIMRNLAEGAGRNGIEMIDGVRIVRPDGWILIMPDAAQPFIHLHAEGDTIEIRDKIIDEFTIKIKKSRNISDK